MPAYNVAMKDIGVKATVICFIKLFRGVINALKALRLATLGFKPDM
jgi:hypothetical protein